MKRIYWMLWMFIPMILSAQSGGEYHIKGKLTEKNPPVRIYLLYRNDRKSFIDSAMIVKGVFVFTGKIVKPVQAELIAAYKGIGLFNLPRQGNCLSFYLAKGDFLIRSHDSIRNADIEDAGINAAYKKYQAFLQVPDRKIRLIDDETRSAMQESRNTDSFRNEVKERMDLVREERKDYQSKFIRQYPDSYFSLVAFEEITGRVMDTAVFGPVFNNLSVRLRKSAEAKYYRDLYTIARTTAIGAIAPDFTQKDIKGKDVRLSDFKGKYVFVDFWASWCGPCRAEIPNVVAAFRRFKEKNFTILGISLDQPPTETNGREAISKDGMVWASCFDTGYKIASVYGVFDIPRNFLIGPDGKIIAKDLRGEDLEKKLAEFIR